MQRVVNPCGMRHLDKARMPAPRITHAIRSLATHASPGMPFGNRRFTKCAQGVGGLGSQLAPGLVRLDPHTFRAHHQRSASVVGRAANSYGGPTCLLQAWSVPAAHRSGDAVHARP
jgi:hypothetical protein